MSNLKYYVGFSYFLGIGPVRFQKLTATFGSPKDAYNASERDLAKVIGVGLAKQFVEFRHTFAISKELDRIVKDDITIISREDTRFPQSFLNLEDPPICIYVKGPIDEYDLQHTTYFAVVGTRKPTPYGIQITQFFSKGLADAGFTIVSGLALGIDAVAHTAALDAGGRTIAILGCGVNYVYPPSNRKLYERILAEKGLIMSEFPPYSTVKQGLFISRNRLVSGLSRGVLVTEGLKQSGSIITARFASEQGKDVFATPGSIFSTQSQAPHFLITQGAKLVTSPDEILDEFGLSKSTTREISELSLSEEELQVYGKLQMSSLDGDEIAGSLSLPIYQVMTLLSSLEISGVIEKNDVGKYQIKR